MRPADDPSWSCYPDTVLELSTPEAVRIDLRRPVDAAARRALERAGFAEPFAVVTSANPRGEQIADDTNERRELRLRRTIAASGRRWARADGVSADGGHREPGVAVVMPRDEAVQLARDFGQSAIFWFDGAAFWLVGALVEAVPQRLPLAADSAGDPGRPAR